MKHLILNISAIATFFLCFTNCNLFAQDRNSTKFTETTFEIHVIDEFSEDFAAICAEALLRYDNLDEYRFVHTDRIVSIQKTGVSVRLVSAKSLFVSSGRFIQDACIDRGEIYSDIEFRLFLQDGQYSIAPIFINEKEHICL